MPNNTLLTNINKNYNITLESNLGDQTNYIKLDFNNTNIEHNLDIITKLKLNNQDESSTNSLN
jgi:hypothetical protein